MSKNQVKTSQVEELNKESRIVLFLIESKDKNKEEIKDLYLNKFKLNEKSNAINIRVIERFIGVYSKYTKEEKAEKIKALKESLATTSVDYTTLVERYKEVKQKSKRSNRLNNFVEIKGV